MRYATAPGTWGVEPPATRPGDPPWERVLDEIAAAGFDGTELGPLGYLPAPPVLAEEIEARGLAMPAGFLMEPLPKPECRRRILDLARRTCETLAAAGAGVLVVIDALEPLRNATAGRSEEARRLTPRGLEQLLEVTDAVVQIAAEHGLAAAFHPHAGTHVEFEDEIDRLLAEASPHLGLCVDSGHAAYAGIDPAALVERHRSRLRHIHLKDLDGGALARCIAAGLSFEAAVGRGVFTPLGAGTVDLPAFGQALAAVGYGGWATYEQDRTPATVDQALPDARASLAYWRSAAAGSSSPCR